VKFAHQAKHVPLVGKDAGYQAFRFSDALVVCLKPGDEPVSTSEKVCSRRGADRILEEGISERNGLVHKLSEPRSLHNVVVVATDRVGPLLVGADPQDIRHPFAISFTAAGGYACACTDGVRCANKPLAFNAPAASRLFLISSRRFKGLFSSSIQIQ
jgi:hypothetical protein